MKTGLVGAIRRYLADESGVSAGVVALSIVFLTGMGGLTVDLGYAYSTRVKLQAATNAAALAGAYYIASGTDPVPVARIYSAGPDNENSAGNGVLTTLLTGTLLCLKTFQTSIPCLGSGSDYPAATTSNPNGGANAIRVVETGRSPTFFAGIFGVSYFPVTATATALAHGGTGKPLDIAMVLDSTASMGDTDATCGLSASATREACAESGMNALLLNMTQQVAKVRLLTFPGFPSQTTANNDWACPKTNPIITPYWTEAPVTGNVGVGTGATGAQGPGTGILYTITTGFEQDYQNTPVTYPATLNQNAPIVIAIGENTTCPAGLGVPGGEGTYYAGALSAAQALLTADGDDPTKTQQVIILLTDGEANSCNNEVVSIPVTSGGSGYTPGSVPAVTVQIPPSSGTDCLEKNLSGATTPVQATATAVMNTAGTSVQSIKVTNGGADYFYTKNTGTPAQTVTIAAPPTGTGHTTATATLTLSSIPGVNQCAQAVAVANAAKASATNTEIFVIAYGSSTTATDCSTDYSPTITPCAALAAIASSDSTATDSIAYFYSDGAGGVTCPGATTVTNLATAGAEIAEVLSKVRLVPNNTT